MSFDESVRATRCPYAALTKWRQLEVNGCLLDERGIGVLEDLGGTARQLILADEDRDLDMLVVELDHPSLTDGLDSVTQAAALFMRGLLGPDALPGQPGDSDADVDHWVAFVAGKRLFVFTLCPFYGESHPRRSATTASYIVIQFLNSFRKINMHRMSLAEKRQLSDKVKSVFTKAGVDYFAYITQASPEALKLVKPLRQGDPPIKWWQAL